MADEIGIRVICADSSCKKSFFIATSEDANKVLSFPDVDAAFEYRSKLIANTAEGFEYHECPHCRAFAPHAGVKEYIVARRVEGHGPEFIEW